MKFLHDQIDNGENLQLVETFATLLSVKRFHAQSICWGGGGGVA